MDSSIIVNQMIDVYKKSDGKDVRVKFYEVIAQYTVKHLVLDVMKGFWM
jgi:hypothetical protein